MDEYQLTKKELDQLFQQPEETKDNGGFQSLLVKLQHQLNGNKIKLSDQDKNRICKYASYSKGGWENTYLENIFGRFDFFKTDTTKSTR